MYTSGTKFEDFSISIFPFHSLLRHHFPNLHNTETLIYLERKQISAKEENAILLYFLKAFK